MLAGLASGLPNWLNDVDLSQVDAIACHPYGKWPSPDWEPAPRWGFGFIGPLLDDYLKFGKPVLVTESMMAARRASRSCG